MITFTQDEAVKLNKALEYSFASLDANEMFMEERKALQDENAALLVLDEMARSMFLAADQTIAALRKEVRSVSDKAERQRGAINGKDREIAALNEDARGLVDSLVDAYNENDSLNDILIQSASYVGQARHLLSFLGITVETDADGKPELDVDFTALLNFAEASVS